MNEERWDLAGWALQRDYASWKALHDAGPEYSAQNASWSHDVYLREGVPTICCAKRGGPGSWSPELPDGYAPLCHGGLFHCNWQWVGGLFPNSQDACRFGEREHNCAPCECCGVRSYYLIEGLFLCQRCRITWMRDRLRDLKEAL